MRVKRQLYACLFEDPFFQSPGLLNGVATDYGATIITIEKLDFGGAPSKIFIISYHEVEDRRLRLNSKVYQITITAEKEDNVIKTSELIQYLQLSATGPRDFTEMLNAIQALNIILEREPSISPIVFQSGRNKYFRNNLDFTNANIYGRFSLGGGLVAVRGHYSNIRISTSRILLNINVQCSAFYPPFGILDLMRE